MLTEKSVVSFGLYVAWEVLVSVADRFGSRAGDLVAADRQLHFSADGGGIHAYSTPSSVPLSNDVALIVLGRAPRVKTSGFSPRSETFVFWLLTPWGMAWIERDLFLQHFHVVKRMPV